MLSVEEEEEKGRMRVLKCRGEMKMVSEKKRISWNMKNNQTATDILVFSRLFD